MPQTSSDRRPYRRDRRSTEFARTPGGFPRNATCNHCGQSEPGLRTQASVRRGRVPYHGWGGWPRLVCVLVPYPYFLIALRRYYEDGWVWTGG